MEISTMGKVQVAAKIENLEDLFKVQAGTLDSDRIRTVEVPDALVDTGAVMLSLPKRLVARLGLKPYRTRRVRTVGGIVETSICAAVRLTVQGRDFTTDVAEIPDECPVLIGQIPLEGLDFVVDPVGQRLIGNPEHGGEHMIDLF
ncbi:MAG TPA: aspartyl protease family protein [Thermoguttaceae bacterium]|nr:aspartyl protease family protein [Thermoguttaceae bacterium]